MNKQQTIEALKQGKRLIKTVGNYYEESYAIDGQKVNGNTVRALDRAAIIREVRGGRTYIAGGLRSVAYEYNEASE